MEAVGPPNHALPSACMRDRDGCEFFMGRVEPNGRCDEPQYICCVFPCEPECN